MEDQNAILIDECEKYGIPVIKKNGQMYSLSTLLKKLKVKEEENPFLGGGDLDLPSIDDEVFDLSRVPKYTEKTEDFEETESAEGAEGAEGIKDLKDLNGLSERIPAEMLGEMFDEGFPSVTGLGSKSPRTSKAKTSRASRASRVKKGEQISDNPLGPIQDYHVDYEPGSGRAILEDPLIQAYFHRLGVTKIEDDSEIPIGLVMAVYGNHALLGDSGLSKKLPNILKNPDLQEYWNSKGITKVSPQTMLPVKWIYLV